ncbi:ATP-binding protein [Paenarthrobacter sp. NPDC089675]|uniref:ATP-binding protein n=1 Tax=Paenarthrobacter sp. NPDC089675 TaxID=3364376 RepID=UPI0038288193
MTDVIARRGFHGPSNEEAIEAIHNELDALWDDASFVPDMDRMTFATAVIEAAANIVQHAEPVAENPVEIDVEIGVWPSRLVARISALNAREPFAEDMQASMPDSEAESGRGLALIEALVTTVTFERQDGTNTWILTRDT